MKTQRRFKRKVRALVAQRQRLIRELRASHARCRQLEPASPAKARKEVR